MSAFMNSKPCLGKLVISYPINPTIIFRKSQSLSHGFTSKGTFTSLCLTDPDRVFWGMSEEIKIKRKKSIFISFRGQFHLVGGLVEQRI